MKFVSTALLTLLVSVSGCSSKKSTPAPAPKTVEQPTAANGAPAKVSAKALWDLAQKDDTQFRKRFVVSGSVDAEDGQRLELMVENVGGDNRRVKLFFATAEARASAVTGDGSSATATATCTLSGTTPMSVRLDDCTPGA